MTNFIRLLLISFLAIISADCISKTVADASLNEVSAAPSTQKNIVLIHITENGGYDVRQNVAAASGPGVQIESGNTSGLRQYISDVNNQGRPISHVIKMDGHSHFQLLISVLDTLVAQHIFEAQIWTEKGWTSIHVPSNGLPAIKTSIDLSITSQGQYFVQTNWETGKKSAILSVGDDLKKLRLLIANEKKKDKDLYVFFNCDKDASVQAWIDALLVIQSESIGNYGIVAVKSRSNTDQSSKIVGQNEGANTSVEEVQHRIKQLEQEQQRLLDQLNKKGQQSQQ